MKLVIGLIIAAVSVAVIDAHLQQDVLSNGTLPTGITIPVPPPSIIRTRLPKYDNKFKSRGSRVKHQQVTSQIATGQWIGLYSVLTGTPASFGKEIGTWRVSGNTVTRTLAFRNIDKNTCETERFHFTLGTGKYGAALLTEVSPGQRSEAFYSQDPSKYFWWDLCEVQGTPRGSCSSGFFDLLIKDTRTNLTGDLNLVGLPWCKIEADLKAIRGLTFADPAVTYVWTGTECPVS